MANTTTNTVKEGDFQSLKLDDWDREMLDDAYKAVTKANRWGFLRRADVPGPKGFMFSEWPEMKDIDTHMEYSGHSGASYGMTMRAMEFIAKNGWDAYVQQVGVKRVASVATATPSTTSPIVNLVARATAIDNFMATNPPTDNLTDFANAIQHNPAMRESIPDIDQQADALRRFAEGKLSYFEMRSLCG
jgi:hypothetical protein